MCFISLHFSFLASGILSILILNILIYNRHFTLLKWDLGILNISAATFALGNKSLNLYQFA